MNFRYLPVIVFFSLTIIQTTSAQNNPKQIPQLDLPAPDPASILAAQNQEPLVALPIPVDIDPNNAGVWEVLPNGDRVWQLEISSPGAAGLALLFDQFFLPKGASLTFFNREKGVFLPVFDENFNNAAGKFITGFLVADRGVLQYRVPSSAQDQTQLHLFRVDYAFKSPGTPSVAVNFGFNASWPCHIDVSCPEGGTWAREKQGICRVLMVLEEGTGFCSGNLLNNTAKDGTPYVLTGFHCQDGYTPLYDMWRFDFNYEGATCGQLTKEPTLNSMTGCAFRAGKRESDFLLIEINDPVPSRFKPYFNGWDRNEFAPTEGVNIHHPVGDVKKISFLNNPARIFNLPIKWDNDVTTPAGFHFEMDYNQGTFQLGSSGSSLFNDDKLVIGQLHGGFQDSCLFNENARAYFARLAVSWDNGETPDTRLMDWLDPLGLDQDTLHGMSLSSATGSISGQVLSVTGKPVGGIQVTLSGDGEGSTISDENGHFLFMDLPLSGTFELQLQREAPAVEGMDVIDIVEVIRHIQSTRLLSSPEQLLAADVDNSGDISVIDVVKMQKILLSLETSFNVANNWNFVRAGHTFANPSQPFSETIPSVYQIRLEAQAVTDLSFVAIKKGDINGSFSGN
ncbi:MAG: hypothetical protein NWS63_11115 [Saprospiraceae bacterium]|nr:hypothetical protein [Saprospiraceae bacterium]MDP4998558.1 hypothetical protein [Saprospiraceae bacterium]